MIIKDVNVQKLHTEFNIQGIYPNPVLIHENGDGEFIFTNDTNMDLVQSIIDAHDPTPIPSLPTQDDFLIDLELRMTMLELGLTL